MVLLAGPGGKTKLGRELRGAGSSEQQIIARRSSPHKSHLSIEYRLNRSYFQWEKSLLNDREIPSKGR
jgi:hypothetical protein